MAVEVGMLLMSDLLITIKLLFFATIRNRVGLSELSVDFPESMTVKKLKGYLGIQFPGLLSAMPSVLVAINREFAFDEDNIPDKAEVAIFPPVSGG